MLAVILVSDFFLQSLLLAPFLSRDAFGSVTNLNCTFTVILCPPSVLPTFNEARLWPKASWHGKQSSKVQLGFLCERGWEPLLPHISVVSDPLTGNALGLWCCLQPEEVQQVVVGLLGQAHLGDHMEGIWSTCCHAIPGHLGKLIYLMENKGVAWIPEQLNHGNWEENRSMMLLVWYNSKRPSLHNQNIIMPLSYTYISTFMTYSAWSPSLHDQDTIMPLSYTYTGFVQKNPFKIHKLFTNLCNMAWKSNTKVRNSSAHLVKRCNA